MASRTVQRLDDADGRAGLARLPFSRDEARAIGLLAGAGTLRATDFQASRATALGSALEDYRIVHFATHGLIDAERPELSGLVLSLVDDRGAPQDGLLRLHDIYNMRLDADLVVLSACQTALGKEIKGEGLVGLTRGFMYAGAPRVVASLWQVSDVATAELMKKFYTGMLRDDCPPRPHCAPRSWRWPGTRGGPRRISGRGSCCRATGSSRTTQQPPPTALRYVSASCRLALLCQILQSGQRKVVCGGNRERA